MTSPLLTSHLLVALYLCLGVTISAAAVLTDIANYDDLEYDPAPENAGKREVDIMSDPFRVGRELEARDLEEIMLALPKDSFRYNLIGSASRPISSGNRYQLKNRVSKRQRSRVQQLAQLLNSMKTRDVDSGVKLETLRFGK